MSLFAKKSRGLIRCCTSLNVGLQNDGALDSLAAFLKELEDLDSMSGPDIMAAIADLPVPQEGFVDGMAFQDAVKVGKTHVL